MRRYTTPTLELVVEGVDLTAMSVWVTIEQHRRKVTIDQPDTDCDGEDTTILVPLSQEQTSAMKVGSARVQVNWTDGHGYRNATEIATVDVEENLLQEVL